MSTTSTGRRGTVTLDSFPVQAGDADCTGPWYIERGDTAVGARLRTRAGDLYAAPFRFTVR